jgi:hypothetical protein
MISTYEGDHPGDSRDYGIASIGPNVSRFGSLDIIKLLVDCGYTDWFLMANNSLLKDNSDSLKYLYEKHDYPVNESNELLYGAGQLDARKSINILLLIKGIDKNNLLYGAARGSHFNLVKYLIDNIDQRTAKQELTIAINHIGGTVYNDTDAYIVKLLVDAGANPTTLVNSDKIDVKYKLEYEEYLTPYSRLILMVKYTNYYFNITPGIMESITTEQLVVAFDTFIEYHNGDWHNYSPASGEFTKLRYILNILLSLHPDLNVFLLMAVRSNNYFLVSKILDSGSFSSSIIDEALVLVFSLDEPDQTSESITSILLSYGGNIDKLFDFLKTLEHNQYIESTDWTIAFELAKEAGRYDLIDKIRSEIKEETF